MQTKTRTRILIAACAALTMACGAVCGIAVYETLCPRVVTLDVGLPKVPNAPKAKGVNYDGFGGFFEAWLTVSELYIEKPQPKKLVQGSIKGMVESLGDKHSRYLPPEDAALFTDDMDGSICGIGATVTNKDGPLTILEVIPGSPAERSKLTANDIILKVDGKSTEGLSLIRAVTIIRGKAGTPVKLTVKREGWPEPKVITVIRAKVEIPNLETKLIRHQGYRLAYLKLRGFTCVTPKRLSQAIDWLQRQKAQGLILDLRDNPGGLLHVAQQVASAWIDNGIVTWVVGRNAQPHPLTGRRTDDLSRRLKDFPTAILINKRSASASELLAACLQDQNQALVVGEKSFGKGSVQTMRRLSDGGMLKLTVQHFLSPMLSKINGEGVKPDREVKLTPEDAKAKRDPQLDEAKKFLIGVLPDYER